MTSHPDATHIQRVRLQDLLRRFCRQEDADKTDVEFVDALHERFHAYRDTTAIIDVNE